MSSRRKAPAPQRLHSLQHHAAVLAERSKAARKKAKGTLASLDFDDDSESEVQESDEDFLMANPRRNGAVVLGLEAMGTDGGGGGGVEEEQDEEADEEDDDVLVVRVAGGANTPLGKRRPARVRPSTGNKRRKRLFKEGRRIELDESDGEQEVEVPESFKPTLQVPLPDPSLKALLVRRQQYDVPEDNTCPVGSELALWIYEASSSARRSLQVTLKEDVNALLLQKDAAEAFGVDSEGLDGVMWLFHHKPMLAYYEAQLCEGRSLQLSIFFTENALRLASPDNVPPPSRAPLKRLRRLMEVLFPTQVPQPLQAPAKVVPFDAMQLYSCLEEYKRTHAKGKGKARAGGTLPELRLTLRPYQQEALEWMISREKGTAYFIEDTDPSDLPHGWLRLADPDNVPVYFNPVSVGLSRVAPAPWSSRGVMGGILADEMGLGKTIEVLSLVLTHRYEPPHVEDEEKEEEEEEDAVQMDVESEGEGEDDDEDEEGEEEEEEDEEEGTDEVMCPCGKITSRKAKWVQCDRCRNWVHLRCAGFASEAEADKAGRFVCEVCHGIERHHAPRQVGATLIVCPQLILSQWEEEIENHCHEGALRVAVYRGIKQIRTPEERRLLDPDHLGGFDVVLTTFDILNNELGHTDNVFVSDRGHDKLRRGKRYRVTPSPLACVVWWRICLDEAQMVETSTTGAAKMALRLHTKHRWCVSGTPISKGQLEDLYGLVLFLRAEPYDDRSWWRFAIEQPYLRGDPDGVSRLHRLLYGLMWRTSKKCVKDQLALPPQTEVTRKLRFSKVEQHYYLKTQEACERAVVEALRRAKREGGKDSAASLHKCAAPLLRLRQACCHPQVGAGGIRANRLMSMDEIKHKLLDDCRIECEETQRLLLMDLCGLAAVVRIQAQVALMDGQQHNGERFLTEAGRFYERALLTAEENRVPVPIPAAALLEVAGNHNMATLPTGEGGTAICVEWGAEEQGVPSEDDPWWARVVFLSGKKVNGLRMRVGEGSRLCPRQCRLLASNSSEGYLFMEVATFDLLALPLAEPSHGEGEGRGDRMLRGINMHEARVWKLEICAAEEPAPASGSAGLSSSLVSSIPAPALRLQLDMMTAEIDVDMMQILHISANFAEVLAQQAGGDTVEAMDASSSSSFSSSSAAAPAVEDPVAREVETLTEYSQLQGRPLGHRVAWLRMQANAVKTRTASLCMQIHRLNRHLMERAETAIASLKEELKGTRARHGGGSQGVAWWEWLLVQLDRNPTPSSDKLLARIRSDGASNGVFAKAKGFNGLLLTLKTRIEEVMDGRRKLLKKIKALNEKPSDKEVAESGNCQRCRQDWKKQGPVCKNCHLSDEIEAYDKMLFTYTKQSLNHMADDEEEDEVAQPARGGRRDGFVALGGEEEVSDMFFQSAVLKVRAPSEAFRLLYTTLLNWLRLEAPKRKQAEPLWGHMAEEAAAVGKYHTLLGGERLAMQRMWNAHQDLLSLLDEASAAATRLRLALPDEDPLTMSEDERKLVVFLGEALGRREEFYNQTVAYEATLKEKKHQLAFLKNMTQSSENETSEVGECAVCLASMKGAPVMVLPCAHYFCETCVKRLLKGQSNKCPTCRKPFTRADVRKSHNVAKAARERREAEEREKARGGENGDDEGMDGEAEGKGKGKTREGQEKEEEEVDVSGVAGSWGTKVSALVAEIQRLPCEDKCLVFSEWDEMLDVVEAALKANHVRSVRLKGERKAAATRAAFKHEADLRCLLLNLKTAAKGLTLVEANHVFLLEPVFNAATEAQAINRIHRIGQTRPTFVHRFVVRETIEEKVEAMRRRSLAAAGGEDGVLSSVKKGRANAEAEVTLHQYELLFSPKSGRKKAEEDGRGSAALGGRRIFDDEEEEEDDEVVVEERPRVRAVRRSGVRRVGGLSAEELASGQLAAGEGGRSRRSTARASNAQADENADGN